MKKRRFSLTTRYVVIVGVLLLAANIVLGIVMMSQSKAMMNTMIRKNMLDISNTAAALLDGDVMAALTADDVGTPKYQDISDKLLVFQNNVDIEFIYAVREVGPGRFVFTVDPDPVDPAQFGEEIVVTDALIEAGKAGRRWTTPLSPTAGEIFTARTALSSIPRAGSRALWAWTSAPSGTKCRSGSTHSPSASSPCCPF